MNINIYKIVNPLYRDMLVIAPYISDALCKYKEYLEKHEANDYDAHVIYSAISGIDKVIDNYNSNSLIK